MKYRYLLQEIHHYYRATRQAGHTTLMKQGVSNYEKRKLVLLVNREQGREIGLKRDEIVTVHSLNRLRGNNLPLVIDNGALCHIFEQTAKEFNAIEKERDVYKNESRKQQLLKEKVEKEINYMKSHPFKTLFKTLWRR